MGAHVARDFLRVGPRVLPQRPPDRLADEEVAVGQVRLDVRVEQVEVRLALELQLADDRNAALPEVGMGAPLAHERRSPPLEAPHLHVSEDLARDPPHRKQVEAVVRHRRFHIGLHTDRFLRISRERHLAAEPGDYGAGRYVAFTGPSSSTLSTHVDPFSNPPAPALTRLRWTRSSTSSHTISPCVLSTAPSSFWSVRNSSRPLSP